MVCFFKTYFSFTDTLNCPKFFKPVKVFWSFSLKKLKPIKSNKNRLFYNTMILIMWITKKKLFWIFLTNLIFLNFLIILFHSVILVFHSLNFFVEIILAFLTNNSTLFIVSLYKQRFYNNEIATYNTNNPYNFILFFGF